LSITQTPVSKGLSKIYFMKIVKAHIKDYQTIYDIAVPVWNATYKSILKAEQLDYMLKLMYSQEAIAEQMSTKGHQFLLALDDNAAVGFTSYEVNYGAQITKIHKLYVLPETHGKGIGRALINEIEKAATADDNNTLILNVNRFNPAVNFYNKIGFLNIGEEDVAIGNGYLMEDFIMQKHL
jgi:GNAT superfamily N-acetyltransferase